MRPGLLVGSVLALAAAAGLVALAAGGCGGRRGGREAKAGLPSPEPEFAFPSPTAEPPVPSPSPVTPETFDFYRPREPRPASELERAAAPAASHPPVVGRVKSVSRTRKHVTIDRGADDGIREGDTVLLVHEEMAPPDGNIAVGKNEQVLRERYVGKAIVVKVKPHECTARLIVDMNAVGQPVQPGDIAVAQEY